MLPGGVVGGDSTPRGSSACRHLPLVFVDGGLLPRPPPEPLFLGLPAAGLAVVGGDGCGVAAVTWWTILPGSGRARSAPRRRGTGCSRFRATTQQPAPLVWPRRAGHPRRGQLDGQDRQRAGSASPACRLRRDDEKHRSTGGRGVRGRHREVIVSQVRVDDRGLPRTRVACSPAVCPRRRRRLAADASRPVSARSPDTRVDRIPTGQDFAVSSGAAYDHREPNSRTPVGHLRRGGDAKLAGVVELHDVVASRGRPIRGGVVAPDAPPGSRRFRGLDLDLGGLAGVEHDRRVAGDPDRRVVDLVGRGGRSRCRR